MTYGIGSVSWLNTLALEEESHRRHALALAIAESTHELFKLRASLDLEEDFVVVVGHLDVKVLGGARSGGLGLRGAAILRVVRHCKLWVPLVSYGRETGSVQWLDRDTAEVVAMRGLGRSQRGSWRGIEGKGGGVK